MADSIKRLEQSVGKPLEQFLGEKINEGMSKSEFSRQYLGLTILVGLHNRRTLPNGQEIDVPVLIIEGDRIRRFAVEYDGELFHTGAVEQERDRKKDKALERQEWIVIRITDVGPGNVQPQVTEAAARILSYLTPSI